MGKLIRIPKLEDIWNNSIKELAPNIENILKISIGLN